MPVQIARHCFTVDEYYRMAEAGILSKDDHVELLEGEVVEMSPIGSRHAACVRRLDALLNRDAAQLALVSVQSPIRLTNFQSRSRT
ncbi:MAG: Uma2 family endonuclease [Acidobacteriota bacterium]|nr:Uma2 family endonuclease [Acidobacteriota bacterium]